MSEIAKKFGTGREYSATIILAEGHVCLFADGFGSNEQEAVE